MGFYCDADFQPDVSVGYLAKRVHQLAQGGLEPLFAREGLTNVQWHALISIYFGRGTTSAKLARDLSYDKGATTRLIDQLELRGWVERARGQGDRRLVALKLTPTGEAVARKCRRLVVRAWNEWLSDWPEQDIVAAIAALQRLRGTLEQVGR
ncbi:MarR family transcriptional regulator [Sphingomonas sp.]|jgi:DNA-binding MarR family transcriptional regulator|uniref:MarR family winged helix-turn-helix transcriptional regulator n=1 Tax=Sphingomonas sp. TaxID=28214 RepID=UPI002D80A3BE|nr:MarR family transcriptional regulator [Sphingomonas sp.]HEU0044340.1 MarR family transcriptional regulator [Sphingomonas sp.]